MRQALRRARPRYRLNFRTRVDEADASANACRTAGAEVLLDAYVVRNPDDADGYNLAYVSPEEFKQRMEVVDRTCDRLKRDPATLTRSVNLHFHMGADAAGAKAAQEKLSKFPPDRRLGAITGTPPEAIDRISMYMEAGADGLNIAFRPPVDWEAFEAYIERVLPVFHRAP